MSFFEFLQKNKTIELNMLAEDWKDAIRKGGKLLLDAGCCTESYIESIIDVCIEKGPYFVLAPGLAMPHSRPENGVIKTGYALVLLNKSVEFGDPENDPIDILIFMAAKDSTTHTEESMSQIAGLCDNVDWIMELRTAQDISTALKVINRAEKQFGMF